MRHRGTEYILFSSKKSEQNSVYRIYNFENYSTLCVRQLFHFFALLGSNCYKIFMIDENFRKYLSVF